MITDYDLEQMEKTFRSEAKFNCMGGMGLKLIAEIRCLQKASRGSKVTGIRLAADVAKDYDKFSLHGFLVSDCILGKLNVLKRKPRRNPAAGKIKKTLDKLDQKLEGVEGTMRFMARSAKSST